MSNLNSIQKALESAKRKDGQIKTLKRLVSNVESKTVDRSLFSGEVYVYDGNGNERVLLSASMLEFLLPKELAVAHANAKIKKLETELNDLNVLLDAFDKVMEPILKEQKQC